MQQETLTEEVELERESMAACKNPPSLKTPPASELRRQSPPVPLDLQPLIEAFIRHQETIGRAVSTVDSYRINLKYWQKYLVGLGVGELSAITPQIAAGFQAWIYNYRTHFRRPFTLQSQIAILNNIQVFYHYLFNTGKILNNPAEVIRLPKKPRQLPSVILTPHEMKRLLAQPDTSTVLGFRDRTMYEVLYSTGIRIGELIGLRVQDVSLEQGTLFIHGKGGKDRVIPVGATACRYLAEYVKRIRPMFRPVRQAQGEQAKATDVLFFNRDGRPQKKAGIWEKLKLYALRAGIEKRVTVHTFRHTLATEMLKGGADIRQIQELLGHTNLRTTQIYTHIVKGDLRRVQAQCHPREQTELPENFVTYRGRKYLTDDDRREVAHVRKNRDET